MDWFEGVEKKFGSIGKICSIAAILFAVIIITYAGDVDINNPENCPKGTMNITAKNICCTNLNKRRRPFPDCCWYPMLVIWRWQYELCVAKCNDDLSSYTSASYRCCVLPCCFQYLKVIGAHPEIDGISADGLKFSFLLSVFNDTRWNDTIDSAVGKSYSQYKQDIRNMTGVTDPTEIKAYDQLWDCFELIPNYLYDIIDSAYNQNYLQCPIFNSSLERCDVTKQYVQDCFVDYDE